MPNATLLRGRLGEIAAEHGEVLTVEYDVSALEAARRMRTHNVGCLVVTDKAGKPVGIVTEHDLVTKVLAAPLSPEAISVRHVMTAELVSAGPDASINEAREIMARHRIRHLPIVDDGVLVGIVSSRDVLAHQFAAIKAVITQNSQLLRDLHEDSLNPA